MLSTVLIVVLYAALVIHIILMGVALWRVWRGENIVDRLIGADLITTITLAILVILAVIDRNSIYIDAALGLAALGLSAITAIYLLLLYVLTQTQQRPIFWAAGGLALAGLLLILVGFIAELIVSQGEQIKEMEWRLDAFMAEAGYGQKPGFSKKPGFSTDEAAAVANPASRSS